ncbi:uncharacterized protein LOC114960956 isoform X1 [Acropora millepora]|uniref:uncharacterized protein LOC114960956 isoform X1 n=1 Tax=Acropora millepora TaxID=45264 RepID=UPI001CF110E1|nr:uncharacterized protein LOC114960956 isoform X1 [Acropora millepora]
MHSVFVQFALSLIIGLESSIVDSRFSPRDFSQRRLQRHESEVRPGRHSRSVSELPCINRTNCRYIAAMVNFPPYVMISSWVTQRGFLYKQIIHHVETACLALQSVDDLPTCCVERLFVNTSDEMIQLIKNKKVDFAFPIQAEAGEKLQNIPFVTLIRVYVAKGSSLIVNTKVCQAESRQQLMTSITSQWPILAFIILLSGVSGVIIWLLERRASNGQFSTSFTAGSPEGFWWAVVSLTTVGYGDQTPTTFLGRMYGVIWILVGAIMMSLFTALFTNAMQGALDGTRCKDITSKDVGVWIENSEIQMVAVEEFDANVVKFNSIAEMQMNISSGAIGRVLVDQDTAFHFLADSRLKRNRQIRLIKNIDYPMDYFMVHVSRTSDPGAAKTSEEEMHEIFMTDNGNDTNLHEEEEEPGGDPRTELALCGPLLKELSQDIVGASKQSAMEQVIRAPVQTASLSNEIEGLFSAEWSKITFILFCLVGILLSLGFLGILWEIFVRGTARIHARRELKETGSPTLHRHSDNGNLAPLKKKFFLMQNFLGMEERLRDFTADLEKMREEFASTIAHEDTFRGQQRQRPEDMNSAGKGRSLFETDV